MAGTPRPEERPRQPSGGGGSSRGSAGGRGRGSGGSNRRRRSGGASRGPDNGSGRSDRRPQGRPGVPPPPAPAAPRAPTLVAEVDVQRNRRRALVLSAAPALAVGLVLGAIAGLGGGPLIGVVVAVVLMVAVVVILRSAAVPVALRLLGAEQFGEGAEPRIENVVDGLCATFGLRAPQLAVVDDPVPNACSIGLDPSHAVLVVTSGLVAQLDLVELEGVVAHELAHVRRIDILPSTLALVVLAPWARLTGSDGALHRALGRGREIAADNIAVAAVRYPPGLCRALVALQAGPAPAPGSVFEPRRLPVSRWLWIDPMVDEQGAQESGGELDGTPVRAAALAER